jgi:hypothetical protein
LGAQRAREARLKAATREEVRRFVHETTGTRSPPRTSEKALFRSLDQIGVPVLRAALFRWFLVCLSWGATRPA